MAHIFSFHWHRKSSHFPPFLAPDQGSQTWPKSIKPSWPPATRMFPGWGSVHQPTLPWNSMELSWNPRTSKNYPVSCDPVVEHLPCWCVFLVDLTHQNGGTERFNTPGGILKMMDFTEKGKLFHHPCLVCVFLGFIWIYPYQVQKQGSYGSFNNQTWWTIAMWASKIRI